MGFISTSEVELKFKELFTRKERVAFSEVFYSLVANKESVSYGCSLAWRDNDFRGAVDQILMSFELFFCHRIGQGFFYPERWYEILDEQRRISDEPLTFHGWEYFDLYEEIPLEHRKLARLESVLSLGKTRFPPWHGHHPSMISQNLDWQVCLAALGCNFHGRIMMITEDLAETDSFEDATQYLGSLNEIEDFYLFMNPNFSETDLPMGFDL